MPWMRILESSSGARKERRGASTAERLAIVRTVVVLHLPVTWHRLNLHLLLPFLRIR